jgi:hypothetical protein
MKLMSGLLVFGLFLTAIFIQGCGAETVTNATTNAVVCNRPYILVGTACCLDANNNGVCDKDEVQTPENPPVTPPVKTPSEFTMKDGDVVTVAGKDVTLFDFSIFQGKLEAVVDVDGKTWDIYESNKPEIVNGLRITAVEIGRLQTYVVLKIEPLVLAPGEYLFNTNVDQVVLGRIVRLTDIQDDDGVMVTVVDGGQEYDIFVMPNDTKVAGGLKITNVEAFHRTTRAERYAILRVEFA